MGVGPSCIILTQEERRIRQPTKWGAENIIHVLRELNCQSVAIPQNDVDSLQTYTNCFESLIVSGVHSPPPISALMFFAVIEAPNAVATGMFVSFTAFSRIMSVSQFW